jgi:hypothetical protein
VHKSGLDIVKKCLQPMRGEYQRMVSRILAGLMQVVASPAMVNGDGAADIELASPVTLTSGFFTSGDLTKNPR